MPRPYRCYDKKVLVTTNNKQKENSHIQRKLAYNKGQERKDAKKR